MALVDRSDRAYCPRQTIKDCIVKRSTLPKLILTVFAFSVSSLAFAAPVCTNVPQAKWLTQPQLKAKTAPYGIPIP